jgi:hypothetical protein
MTMMIENTFDPMTPVNVVDDSGIVFPPTDLLTAPVVNTNEIGGTQSQPSVCDEATPNLFQVGYYDESIGKYRKSSKKKITWVFRVGHRNGDVDNGQGTATTDHTVSLTWSKSTGKQEVEMDGSNVWFGRRRGASVFDHRWTTDQYNNTTGTTPSPAEPTLRMHILSTCAPRMSENFRKHDLIINGQVFAQLPTCHDAGGVSTMAVGGLSQLEDNRDEKMMVNMPDQNDHVDTETLENNGSVPTPSSIFYLLYPDGVVHDAECVNQ